MAKYHKIISIGEISATACDKAGVEIADIRLGAVSLAPKCPFNVISIAQPMMNGWKLSGDGNRGLTLIK